jgi:hypothetical protein
MISSVDLMGMRFAFPVESDWKHNFVFAVDN